MYEGCFLWAVVSVFSFAKQLRTGPVNNLTEEASELTSVPCVCWWTSPIFKWGRPGHPRAYGGR